MVEQTPNRLYLFVKVPYYTIYNKIFNFGNKRNFFAGLECELPEFIDQSWKGLFPSPLCSCLEIYALYCKMKILPKIDRGICLFLRNSCFKFEHILNACTIKSLAFTCPDTCLAISERILYVVFIYLYTPNIHLHKFKQILFNVF